MRALAAQRIGLPTPRGPRERRPHPGVVDGHLTHEEATSEPQLRPPESPSGRRSRRSSAASRRRSRPVLRLADRRDERRRTAPPGRRPSEQPSSPSRSRLPAADTTASSWSVISGVQSWRVRPARVRCATKQQAAGQLVPRRGAPPARRSSSSSRTDRHEGRVCAGRPRPHEGQPELGGGLLRLVVEVPDHLEVVADESDREEDDGLLPRLCQRAQVVVDVGLQPRHGRRTATALPHQVEGPSRAPPRPPPPAPRPSAPAS